MHHWLQGQSVKLIFGQTSWRQKKQQQKFFFFYFLFSYLSHTDRISNRGRFNVVNVVNVVYVVAPSSFFAQLSRSAKNTFEAFLVSSSSKFQLIEAFV